MSNDRVFKVGNRANLVDSQGEEVGTSENRLEVESKVSKEFAIPDSFGLPKTSFERVIKDFQFSESIVQINFNETLVGSGAITFPGTQGVLLSSGAASSSSVTIETKSTIKQPTLEGLISRWPVSFGTAGVVGNTREFGLNDGIDGWFIRLNGTNLEFVQLKGSVETITPSSAWDVPVTPDTNVHLWMIQQKSAAAGDYDIWYGENTLVHTIRTVGTSPSTQSDKVDLPVRFRNENTTATTNQNLFVPSITINAEGQQAVFLTDGERNASINLSNRINVQAGFSYLFDAEFDTALDTTNLWSTTIVAAASFTQPANTFTIFLKNTTGATDDVLIKSKLLNLRSGTGEFSVFEVGLKFGSNNPVNHVKEWGYLDSSNLNGCFFRLDGGVFKFVTVKGGVEEITEINQAKPNNNFHSFKIEQLGAGKIIGSIINQGQVIDFSPSAISKVGASEKQPFIRSYNTGVPASTPDDMECHWVRLLDTSGSSFVIRGRSDDNVIRDVAVNSSRRLLVSQEPPEPAPGEKPIEESFLNSSNSTIDNIIAITSGETLTVVGFRAGAAGNGAICSAYAADDGSTPNDLSKPIAISFVTPGNNSQSLNSKVVGDGTRTLVLRREPQGGGGARQMYIAITGSETIA